MLVFLSMAEMVTAAPTCCCFQRYLGERLREAVNRCLGAAQQRWPEELLQGYAHMVACARKGLHPITRSPLTRRGSCPALLCDITTRVDEGSCFMKEQLRPLESPWTGISIRCFFAVPKVYWEIKLDSISIREEPFYLDSMGLLAGDHTVVAGLEDARAALGLFLRLRGVRKQEVVREGRGAFSRHVLPRLNRGNAVGWGLSTTPTGSQGEESPSAKPFQDWQALRRSVDEDAFVVGLVLGLITVVEGTHAGR